MGLRRKCGTVKANGMPESIFGGPVRGLAAYETHIFTNQMDTGDEYHIFVEVNDGIDGEMKQVGNPMILTDSQRGSAKIVPILTTEVYDVKIQKISGENRTFSWARYERT